MFLESLKLDGLLSFAPGSERFALEPLNVVIGPNGSGKSNLIEAIELLRALPTGFASAIREGGGVREWMWKGSPLPMPGESGPSAFIDAVIRGGPVDSLLYALEFTANGVSAEIVSERFENARPQAANSPQEPFYYRFAKGDAELLSRGDTSTLIRLVRFRTSESVLNQRKDPDRYPELSWLGTQLQRIQTFREWSFGRTAAIRQPQATDLATDTLLPDARNLALLINQLEHRDGSPRLYELMRGFLPRFQRFSTPLHGATVQLFLHEEGFKAPIPAARLSDGTLRFIAMVVLLLMPEPPPLICIEEPELGLHPDALAILAEVLLEARSRTQLIVTTHSDALVSALSAEVESIVVCEHRGGTVLSRLESGKLAHWLENYRLGDLWRMGELGGNP